MKNPKNGGPSPILLLSLLSLFSLFSLSLAHNKLISPSPWNPSPTKTPPCGGGVSLSAPQAYWYSLSIATIEWLVVGDGLSPLNISIDPSGGTDFSQVIVSTTAAPIIGTNYFNFTVPNVQCTGIDNTCSIQVFSQDGWVACTSVAILPPCTVNCTNELPPKPKCERVTGLEFCSQYNNSEVLLGVGYDAAALDLMVNQSLFEYTYQMPTFMTTGNSSECQKDFKEYLCASIFPSCSKGVLSCQNKCNAFKKSCGLSESHTDLYNCKALPKCPLSQKYDYVIIFTGVAIAVVVLGAFILNFIICKRVKTQYTPIQ